MIRIYTDHALARKMRRHRKDFAAVTAERITETAPGVTDGHKDGCGCVRAACIRARAYAECAAIVRTAGDLY